MPKQFPREKTATYESPRLAQQVFYNNFQILPPWYACWDTLKNVVKPSVFRLPSPHSACSSLNHNGANISFLVNVPSQHIHSGTKNLCFPKGLER